MCCEVLYYADSNEKLVGLLSEGNNFASVLFIFDGGLRYKFTKEELGIRVPSDLLVRNRGVLSLLNPSWEYHLYLLEERYTYSMDSLWGKVSRLRGFPPSEGECHVFVDKKKHHVALFYGHCGEFTCIHRQVREGVLNIKRKEIVGGYRTSSWAEINHLLSVKKDTSNMRITSRKRDK